MSGVAHSIVRARVSTEAFRLEREDDTVSGIAIPELPSYSGYIRGYGGSLEQCSLWLTNASPAAADFEVWMVTPNGEYLVSSGTLNSGPNQSGLIQTTPLVPGEELRVDLLPSSGAGAALDVLSPWADLDVLERDTVPFVPGQYVDALVGSPGRAITNPLNLYLIKPGVDLDVDIRVIDADDNPFFFQRWTGLPNGRAFFINNGPTIRPGYRLQVRATAGEGFFCPYYQERPLR